MAQRERSTYLTHAEIIERAEAYLTDIHRVLEERRKRGSDPERVRMLLDVLTSQQGELKDSFERFEEDAPRAVLTTYAQYTLDVPEHAPPLPERLTSDQLTRWLMEANQPAVDLFRELAEGAENPNLGDIFGSLAQHVRRQNQRIAQESNRFSDL
jgi:hypothetical protein